MTLPVHQLIADGRAALRAGDAVGARRAFELAQTESMSGDVIEGLARASYLEMRFSQAIEGWEHAYAAHREAGDHVGAVRVARTVAYMHLAIVGDRAVGAGWLARAQTLLGDEPDSPERGWVALNVGMFEGNRARKEERFREALASARRVADTDLEFVALDGALLRVRLKGNCAGCPRAALDLKNVVERLVRKRFPQIRAVENTF